MQTIEVQLIEVWLQTKILQKWGCLLNCSKQFSNGFVQGYRTAKPIRSGQSGIIRWNLCKTQMTSFIVFTWTHITMFMTWKFTTFLMFFKSFYSSFNPLTPTTDQNRTSFYNFYTILSRQVMKMKKTITQGIIIWYENKFSKLTSKKLYGIQLGELLMRS